MEWISVKDALPSNDNDVLVFDDKKRFSVSCYLLIHFLGSIYEHSWEERDDHIGLGNVTHWMPLPEPPKDKPYINPLDSWVCKSCGKWELKGSQISIIGDCSNCHAKDVPIFESKG